MYNLWVKPEIAMEVPLSPDLSLDGSLEYSDMSYLADSKKKIRTFIQHYLNSQKHRIFDVETSEVLNELKCKFKVVVVEEFVSTELIREKILAIEPFEENLDLAKLDDRQDLYKRFPVRSLRSIVCGMKLDQGERVDPLFQERCELEVLRFMMNEPCAYDGLLSILGKNYFPWLSKRIRFVFPTVMRKKNRIKVTECKNEMRELEKLIDNLENLENLEKLIAEVESNPYKPDFEYTEHKENRVLHYFPKFSLQFKRESTIILTMIVCIQVFASCSSSFFDYRYSSSLSVLKISVNPIAPKNQVARCIKRIYRDFKNYNNSLKEYARMKQQNRQRTQERAKSNLSIDLPIVLSESSDSYSLKKNPSPKKKKFFSPKLKRIRSPRKLGSPNFGQRAKSDKGLRSSWAKQLTSDSKRVSSAVYPRKRSPKKSVKTFDDLADEVEALIPTMIGHSHHYNRRAVLQSLGGKFSDFEHLKSHSNYVYKLNREMEKISQYKKLSTTLIDLVRNFSYMDENPRDISRICRTSLMDLLDDPEFKSLALSPSNCRFLGKDDHFIPEYKKMRLVIQNVFSLIYQSGYKDIFHYDPDKPDAKKNLAMMSALQVLRLCCLHFYPIQRLLYPYLLRSDWVASKFSNIFPHLNQKEMSDSSNSSASGECSIRGFSIKSKLARRKPETIVGFDHNVFSVDHRYLFRLFRHHKKEPFAFLVTSDIITRDLNKKIWTREMRIRTLTFEKGTLMSLVEFVIMYMDKVAKDRGCFKKIII